VVRGAFALVIFLSDRSRQISIRRLKIGQCLPKITFVRSPPDSNRDRSRQIPIRRLKIDSVTWSATMTWQRRTGEYQESAGSCLKKKQKTKNGNSAGSHFVSSTPLPVVKFAVENRGTEGDGVRRRHGGFHPISADPPGAHADHQPG
jgi:hypothetical protein